MSSMLSKRHISSALRTALPIAPAAACLLALFTGAPAAGGADATAGAASVQTAGAASVQTAGGASVRTAGGAGGTVDGANARMAGGAAHLANSIPFGMGDDNPTMFADPRFAWLGIRYARLIVPWDATRHHADLLRAEAWLNAAHAAGVEPLVAFNQSTNHQNLLPTLPSYAHAVRAFMRRFPWIKLYQTWNEENQGSQPTSHDPVRAARYFNWLNGACHKCSVTAADLLDGPSMTGWLRRFLAAAHRPLLWGLHPYYELDYGGHEAFSTMAHMVHGQIWLTESGLPLWRFLRLSNRFEFTTAAQQERAVRRLLALARLTGRVSRIYYYQWRASITLAAVEKQLHHHRHVTATWDSGLLNPDCSVRPAFTIVSRALGRGSAHMPRVRSADHGTACLVAGKTH